MTDVIFPPYLYPDDESVEIVDRTSTVFRSEFAPGIVQRQEQSAPIMKLSQKYSGMSSSDRGALLAFTRAIKGRVNGILVSPLRYSLRGSFPATELLTNNTFENGTTGWNTGSAVYSASVQDRIYRGTKTTIGADIALLQTLAVVQYVPYVTRAVARFSRAPAASTIIVYSAGDTGVSSAIPVDGGYAAVATVSNSTNLGSTGIFENAGFYSGDYIEVPWMSCSRCALVDNGQNLLLRSDEFGTTWTTAGVSIGTNVATAPDGTTTADRLNESNSSNVEHYVQQGVTVSSAAQDLTCSVSANAVNRTWAAIRMYEGAATPVSVFVNLATGAIGTISTGAGWSNARAHVVSQGNGWYRVSLTARKTTSATAIDFIISAATADSDFDYAGTGGTDAISLWRASLSASSVPVRGTQTTSAATSGSNQTGSALYIKGLPASTNGLLLPGDFFQVGTELKQVISALNSDAAGLGYLQFEPRLFRSPSDNDPVIFNNPFGKFILSDNSKIRNRLGAYADIDLVFEELYE